MSLIQSLLLVAAIVCLILAAFEIKPTGKVNLTAAGLALWAISILLRILWQTK
jgi:hypothetical protein